jgi:hypothetical protein
MNNDNWATETLQVIRTLMECSTIYRRALAPVMSLIGITGLAAGAVGAALGIETPRHFTIYWIAIALVCLTEAFLLIRRQAVKDLEPFWSPPTRQVAQAVTPAFFAGLAVGAVFCMLDSAGRQSLLEREIVVLLVPIWMVFYGLAMHAAGFFMPRRFRMFGWGFIWCGLVALVSLILLSRSTVVLPDGFPLANIAMGAFFGGGHAAYGFYLYFTEKRGIVA